MNVENRKLFANRDARKRLAEMGGILASSPELMGEAMKFANGGTARERAISGQGALDQFASSGMRPLDFSFRDLDRDLGSEMQALDDRVQGRIVSFLGNLFEVVGDKIFHTESGVEIEEPNLKAEILTQGDRIAGEDLAMAVPFPQGQDRNYTQLVSDIENPIERGRALLAASSPEVELENAPITSMNRIAGEDMAMAQDVPQGQPRVFAQPESEPEVMFPGELSRAFVPEPRGAEELMAGSIYPAEERSFNGSEQKLLNAMNPAFDSFGGDLLANDVRGAKDVRGATDIMAGPIYPAEERSSTSKLSSMDFSTDPTKGYPFPTDVPKDDPKYEAQSVVEAMTKSSNPAELEAQLEDIQDRKEEARRTQEMADAEREQMTGMPDLAAPEKVDVDALLEAAKENNPAAATEALKKRFMDRDSDIVPSTVDQLTKEPPKGDPDAPKTRKQRMLESVDMISELFGIREKDKAEDMYDLMATIGFAMASGESPNAMKNIADAFLVGAQMKRADKKEAKADERAIQKLAYQTILNQDATAAEQKAARDLLEEKYGYMEDLETLKAELNPASQTSKPPSLEKAILDAIGDAAQAKSAPLTEDEIQKVTDTVIRIYQGNYQTGTASGKTPGQAQTLADIPTNDKTGG